MFSILHIAYSGYLSYTLPTTAPIRRPNFVIIEGSYRVLFANKLRYSPDVMRIHRYTQWDGTQEVLFPTPDDLLKHLSDNLLEELRRALRDLMRRGLTSEDGQRSVKGIEIFCARRVNGAELLKEIFSRLLQADS